MGTAAGGLESGAESIRDLVGRPRSDGRIELKPAPGLASGWSAAGSRVRSYKAPWEPSRCLPLVGPEPPRPVRRFKPLPYPKNRLHKTLDTTSSTAKPVARAGCASATSTLAHRSAPDVSSLRLWLPPPVERQRGQAQPAMLTELSLAESARLVLGLQLRGFRSTPPQPHSSHLFLLIHSPTKTPALGVRKDV